MQHSLLPRGIGTAAMGVLSLCWGALSVAAQEVAAQTSPQESLALYSDWLGSGEASALNPSSPPSWSGRRLTVTYGTWGVYGGAPAEKRCDSTLFTGQFACCWKNRMTKEVAKRLRTRYRWVCESEPSVLDCQQAVAPGNKSLNEEPHACKRHVHNYVEYSLQMTLYYVLYSSGEAIVLDDTIAPNCSVGIRSGTADLLQVSTTSVEILAGPTLTTAAMQDGAWVQSLAVSLRFVPDYELDRIYLAALAEGNETASELYNLTLENIHEAMTSKNALADLPALDEHLTRSLRDMGAALSHVNVEGLNVTTSRRNRLGDVIRDSSPGEVSQAYHACAGLRLPLLWLSLVFGALLSDATLRAGKLL